MTEKTSLNLEQINQRITDRSNCFYWQTDRAVDPKEAGAIFADRHASITEDELVVCSEQTLGSQVRLVPRGQAVQNDLGNVNIVRELEADGKPYILRAHPKGLRNGYFWVESGLAQLLKRGGLPGYDTATVQDMDNQHPFAFILIERMPGTALKIHLERSPDDELKMVAAAGKTMAQMHQIKLDGFGFLDNKLAKNGILQGAKTSHKQHVLAGLDFNLDTLISQKVLDKTEAKSIKVLFETSHLSEINQATLVHNDFADWNLLTDGNSITGILDLDEAFAGDPVADLACWTTFYDLERYRDFVAAYQTEAKLPHDYEERLWFYRLRYLVSKMTLRTRRLTWDFGPHRPMLEAKVAAGRQDLEQAMDKTL